MSCSLLYDNFLQPPMLSASSYAPAASMGVIPNVAGSAIFEVQGAYTGILDADYVVQFATVDGSGTLLGSRYRWSDSGGVIWNAEDLTPVPGTFVTLNNGVQIRFTNGPALPYVQLGDTWQFRAIRKWGVAALVDWSRNTELRSAAVAEGSTWDLTADLGSSLSPGAVVLYDHNLLPTTLIRLQGSSTSNFAALTTNVLLPYQATKLVAYPAASAAPYWRLRLTIGIGQGDIRLAEWYLGSRVIVPISFRQGYSRRLQRLGGATDLTILTQGQGVPGIESDTYELVFGQRRPADVVKFLDLAKALNAWTLGDLQPFYLVPNDADLTDFGLYHWLNGLERQNRQDGVDDLPMTLIGLARSLL